MHTKTELLEILRTHHLRLSKRLGQHYLMDPRMTQRVVASCKIGATDTVIEIGAGLGALTDLLAARAARVIAVECDRAMCELLGTRMAAYPNVEVRQQDILTFPWEDAPRCKVIGAIPYHITSPILLALCEQATMVTDAWLGLQQEVAQRAAALPGTKAYGRLTILLQMHFTIQPLVRMSRAAFFPQPAVDSMWVHLQRRASPSVFVRDPRLLFAVVQAAFSQRRKTLANCLMTLKAPRLSRPAAVALLREAGLSERVRGETLSLEAFARLTNALDASSRSATT